MWANLLDILSRSGVGSCLTPQDMRDEANNFVMGLLFLSGDWWEGSGGPGPEPRRGDRMESEARLLLRDQPKLPMLGGQAGPARSQPKGNQRLPPISMLLALRVSECTSWSHSHKAPLYDTFMLQTSTAVSSFVPSVKFPVTSMGFHVQNTWDLWDPGAKLRLCGFYAYVFYCLETSAWDQVHVLNSGQMVGVEA